MKITSRITVTKDKTEKVLEITELNPDHAKEVFVQFWSPLTIESGLPLPQYQFPPNQLGERKTQ